MVARLSGRGRQNATKSLPWEGNVTRSKLLAAVAATVFSVAAAGAAPTNAGSTSTQSIQAIEHDKPIRFGAVDFDPLRRAPASDPNYRRAGDGKGLRFVQFNDRIQSSWLGELRSAGARPLQYYPHDTYLIWADDAALNSLRSWSQVRWSGEYQPNWKIEPGLDKRQGWIENVGVHFYNDGDVDAVLVALQAAGALVINHGPAQSDRLFHDAWIRVDAARLPALAALPQVVWLEYASAQPILDDELSSQIVARNYDASNVPQLGYLPWLSALGYDGSGLVWAVIDSGIDYTHPDFAGRIVGGVNYGTCPAGNGPGDDPATGGHGTHVAGIVGGTGAAGFADAQGFLYGVGMAPGVGLFAQNPICAGGQSWPPTGGWQRLSRDALLGGAIGGNGSWTSGESGGTTYTAGARAWDQIVRDGNFDTPLHEAFIMVFSAGNSGPGAGTLTAPKAAKNPIITGGTQNYRVSSNIDAVYNASSRGPTQDGRFGITVAAPAQSVASARRLVSTSQCTATIAGTNNHYSLCSGTSMAAPHVSGTAVLLSDWWRDQNGGAIPSPAMIKALLINGAKDYGGGGVIPNTTQGWGRIDLPGSLGLDFQFSEYVDQTEVFDNVGQVFEVTYGVHEPEKPVRVSLAWTDAAAAAGANPTLVNDLDLEVETGGQLYRGNVFSGGVSVTGGSADTLNNEENVFVAAPGDTVTVRVIARNLPGDGIPGNAAPTDQDFALVCRNCVEQEGFSLTVQPANLAVCAPNDALFDIEVGSILGYDEAVALSVLGTPAGTTSQFTINPVVPSGNSQLQIGNTAAAAAGDYALEITGTSVDQTRSVERQLQIATGAPDEPLLQSPAHQAVGISYTPTLTWMAAAQAAGYQLQLSDEPGFDTPLLDVLVASTSTQVVTPLNSSTNYYWRVRAGNVCGDGGWSQVFRFRTQPAPGDCDLSTQPVVVFDEDFSAGLGAFTTTGSVGASTWAPSGARPSPVSGGNAALAVNLPSVSDQRLISPPIDLPSGQSPLTLQFWNHQTLESRTAGGCWDGGLLEVSTNAGGSWTQIGGSAILNRAYDGAIASGYNNPLIGQQAWCGDPRDWENYIIDIDAYAGQTVQFRWRLGTDSTVGREGWYVDDIVVRACQAGGDPDQADLNVSIAALPDPVLIGEPLTYLIQVGNDGPDAAEDIELTLSLPAGVDFAALVAGGPAWSCTPLAGAVACSFVGTLPAAALAPSLEIEVDVLAGAASILQTEVEVSSSTDDPDPSNNQASVETRVIDPADLIFRHDFECAVGLPGCQ